MAIFFSRFFLAQWFLATGGCPLHCLMAVSATVLAGSATLVAASAILLAASATAAMSTFDTEAKSRWVNSGRKLCDLMASQS